MTGIRLDVFKGALQINHLKLTLEERCQKHGEPCLRPLNHDL